MGVASFLMATNIPTTPGKAEGDFDQFTSFMRKLVSVPHDTIKARLEAEKAAKVSRASASESKRR